MTNKNPSNKRGSYAWLRSLPTKQFRRLVGVKPRLFRRMVRALEEEEKSKKKAGRSSKLSMEDRLLMTLQYLREYPTLLRLGMDWGVHESTAQRIVTRTEKALLDSGEFSLPRIRALARRLVALPVARRSSRKATVSRWCSLMWLRAR